jgi:AcrR family transcriptional regulator
MRPDTMRPETVQPETVQPDTVPMDAVVLDDAPQRQPGSGPAVPRSRQAPRRPAPPAPRRESPAGAPGAGGPGGEPGGTSRRPGRPRSGQADQAIIDATLDLFADYGPDGLNIEQVAARAGVGKATIYRRWPGKEDLLLDAIDALRVPLPQPQGRSVRADLTALVEALCKEAADPRRRRLFALLHGEGVGYPRLAAKFGEVIMEPRRELIRSVLRRGVATGELRETTDVDAAMYLLSGAVLARSGAGPQPAGTRYAKRVVDELLQGLSAR